MNRTLLSLMIPCLLMTGCAEPEIEILRQQFVVDAAPGDPMVVSKIRKALTEADALQAMDVVVRGRIYAGADSSPWMEGKAGFILADFSGHDGNKEHDPFGCPYCSESIEDYRVFVTFLDDGETAGFDSRELFGVSEKQSVVIKGVASMEGDDVNMTGTKIFIEK